MEGHGSKKKFTHRRIYSSSSDEDRYKGMNPRARSRGYRRYNPDKRSRDQVQFNQISNMVANKLANKMMNQAFKRY